MKVYKNLIYMIIVCGMLNAHASSQVELGDHCTKDSDCQKRGIVDYIPKCEKSHCLAKASPGMIL